MDEVVVKWIVGALIPINLAALGYIVTRLHKVSEKAHSRMTNIEKEDRRTSEQNQRDINAVAHDLNKFSTHVAQTYPTHEHLKQTEDRLMAAINENKKDTKASLARIEDILRRGNGRSH